MESDPRSAQSTVFCGACGSQIDAAARFCPSCGADQRQFAESGAEEARESVAHTRRAVDPGAGDPDSEAAPHEPTSDTGWSAGAGPRSQGGAGRQPAEERIESIAPGATELAERLAAYARTPTVVTATVSAALAALAVFVVALIVAAIFSADATIGSVETDPIFDEDAEAVGLLVEAFRHMVQFLLVGFEGGQAALLGDGHVRVGPVLASILQQAPIAVRLQ